MDDSEWVTCPYERAHRVPRQRLQRHLVKCEKLYPPLGVCPYDARHRVPPAQLQAHTDACATRQELRQRGEREERALPLKPPPLPPALPGDEEWD